MYWCNQIAECGLFNMVIDILWYVAKLTFGGESEIRTRDKVTPVPPFQGGDLNRSSISPVVLIGRANCTACRWRIIVDLPSTTNRFNQVGTTNNGKQ